MTERQMIQEAIEENGKRIAKKWDEITGNSPWLREDTHLKLEEYDRLLEEAFRLKEEYLHSLRGERTGQKFGF
jgi:hypothetical protein